MAPVSARGPGLSASVLTIAQSRGAVRSDLPPPLLASLVFGLLESLDRDLLATSPDPSALPVEQTAAMYTGLLERLLRP